MTAFRSTCPLATFLDLWGDRWSLLILRDLMRGRDRFGTMQANPERIPASILAARLKALVAEGYVSRIRYCDHPPRDRYLLTEKGESLRPVLGAMMAWSQEHAPGVEIVIRGGRDGGEHSA